MRAKLPSQKQTAAMHRRSFDLPLESGLGLRRITNAAGLDFSVLPNACVFALEHEQDGRRTMLNQVLGSPLGAGIMRILLRVGGNEPCIIEAVGPRAKVDFGAGQDRFVWEGRTAGLRHRVDALASPFTGALALAHRGGEYSAPKKRPATLSLFRILALVRGASS